jgi:periplasmic divalent cation tolerance protein
MILVLSTYPSRRSAEKAAAGLVENGLAACASVISIESSIYRWEGKLEKHPERLLLIKTAKRAYAPVERWIKGTHPHRVPEIICIDVRCGSKGYIDWVESCVSAKGGRR